MTDRKRANPQVELLLRVIDQAYDQRAWHGPNLHGSLRGVTPAQAAWRPGPERHCIAEQVLHAAYWKYVAWRRLRGEKRGSFPLKGSDWLPLPQPWNKKAWRQCVELLECEHRALRAALSELCDRDLPQAPARSKVSTMALISGVAAHDVYHTGQIQLLKRMQKIAARAPTRPRKGSKR